jgi:hypothetical protein
MISLFIVDDFHPKPFELRKFALKQNFNIDGNYPGHRTRSFLRDIDYQLETGPKPEEVPNYKSTIMQRLADIVRPFAGEVTWWGDNIESGGYSGAFQYTTSRDTSWIHTDDTTHWAGVLYLTPNAPITSGTGLFKHKLTGWKTHPYFDDGEINVNLRDLLYYDAWDKTKWDMHAMVGNVFNRLILYKADQWHQSLDYFGHDVNDGRLFMTFFFNTEFPYNS